jgi:hypothetical protein
LILHVGPTRTRTTKSRSRYRPSFTPTARPTHGQEPGGWCHHQHVLQPARRAQELGVRDGEDHDHRDDPTDGHRLRRAKDPGERSAPRANRACTSATRSRTQRRTPSPWPCTRSAATAARRTSATWCASSRPRRLASSRGRPSRWTVGSQSSSTTTYANYSRH